MNRRTFISTSLGLAATLKAASASSAPIQPQARPTSSLPFDIAILGAGLFGSAAARYLSEQHEGVVLIGPSEPVQPQTHHGVFASHYDVSRLTRIVDPDLLWGTLAKRSVARYRDIEQRSGIRFYHDIGYMMVTPGGLGTEWFNFPAMREVAADLRVDLEELDDAALRRRFPYLRFTPGSGAMHQAQDAGYINPRHLVKAQQTIALAQGATLLREEVVQVRRRGDQVEIKTRGGETVYANRVLIATGASTNATQLLSHRLDTQIRAAMIMVTEVVPETPATYPSILYAKTDGQEPFWGLLMPPITYPDGRSYIKTMDGYYGPAPLEGYEALGSWSRSEGHVEHHPVLQRALHEVFPSLQVVANHYKPCLITDTASHYPYIDMVDERMGLVVGGNGKSAKSSDEIGRLAAEMIRTRGWTSSMPQAMFAAQFV